jgi:glycosyltransferase involved in cell wall biosynthesis
VRGVHLKPTAFVWSWLNLGGIPAGSTGNEVARLKELTNDFSLQAYLLCDAKTPEDLRKRVRFWFGNPISGLHLLPSSNIPDGFRGIFSLMFGIYVSITLIMASRENRIDLVITRLPIPSLPVLIVSRMLRLRSVYNVLTIPFTYKETTSIVYRNPLTRGLMRTVDYACLSLSNRIGIGSPATALEIGRELGRGYQSKTIYLPYPIPEYFFQQTRAISEDESIVLGYLGELYDTYDFRPLIEAINDLTSEGVKVQLRIRGAGASASKIKKLFEAGKRIVILEDAPVPRREVPDELRKVTAVVLPLRKLSYSVIPLKAIEAMALGIPVIMANPTDDSQFIHLQTCICVPTNSRGEWRTAIGLLQDREVVQAVVAGGKRIADSYRPGQNGETLLRLVQESDS